MKTISGVVTSSKPVSLSTAASHLKRFVAADMGVPPALSVYVKRTASAFNELVRLHKDANRKHKKSHRVVEENGNPESEIGKKEKRTKKKNLNENETVGDQVEEKRKKRKKEEIEDEKLEDSEEKQTMEKKKKKRKLEF